MILLGSSEKGFGLKKQVHVWITPYDFQNANLMILLAYILLGHKDWEKATINIFAIFPEESVDKERAKLFDLINGGQLPISPQNIEFITKQIETDPKVIINKKSLNADLTIVGFIDKAVKHRGSDEFQGYDDIGNILYVHASESKEIK